MEIVNKSRMHPFYGCVVVKIILLMLAVIVDRALGARMGRFQPNTSLNVPKWPSVKTIHSKDGDIIDCVNIYKQPAFDNSLLQNHTIQMVPRKNISIRKPSSHIQETWQNSGSCPEGTIPILRTQHSSVLRANLSEDDASFDMAAASSYGGPYHGASGRITTWHAVAASNGFSLNLVGCGRGGADGKSLLTINNIFAGWAVHPSLFKDGQSRTFIAWLADNEHLCFNHGCSGFVQVSKDIALGTVRQPSVYGDLLKQHSLSVEIYKEEDIPAKWWVTFDGRPVGYFPIEVVDNLDCNVATWGGLVYRTTKSGPHPTATQMGNGHFSSEGEARTGSIHNALVKRPGGAESAEPPATYHLTRPKCYDFKNDGPGSGDEPGYTYFYGGAGTCT